MSAYLEQLMQIFSGVVCDGDLISKAQRDRLVHDGLVGRIEGYNFITRDGVLVALTSGCAGDDYVPDNKINILASIAVKKFGSMKDGLFNSACFSQAVRDVLGLPLLDGKVVDLILSGRSGTIESDGPSHWRQVWKE